MNHKDTKSAKPHKEGASLRSVGLGSSYEPRYARPEASARCIQQLHSASSLCVAALSVLSGPLFVYLCVL